MKKIMLSFLIFSLSFTCAASPLSQYQQTLQTWKTHKFDVNQIRFFVYHWFGLHDKHVNIQQSYALLCRKNLYMKFPEITVHNKSDYKKWYDGVGKDIQSNVHHVKQIYITFLPNHQYQVDVLVNWQAINRQGKFINMDAKQQWLLNDTQNSTYPCVQKYVVLTFTSAK